MTEEQAENNEAGCLKEQLLRECYRAILAACCDEEGLDSSEGVPLLYRIEALFPDLKATTEGGYRP